MALRLADGWTPGGSIGTWPLPGEPTFAKSRAYELLSRDLRRYVQEEVAGRSFLIAGHRGAGKTATVIQAVRHLRSELLRSSADPEAASFGRRGRLQRPLIVKLVGHSLIAPPPRHEEIEREAAAKDDGSPNRAAAGPGSKAQAGGGAAPGPSERIEGALVHLTIALYRALAGEVAQGFAYHAAAAGSDGADRLELSAQLVLELDGTPEPALLRNYWEKLGRLHAGVLWPSRTDQTFDDRSIVDQGLREIVAVATAAQAFQVCSGAVTYKVTNQDLASNERTARSQLDVKDLVNRLGAMGAGAVAGTAIGIGAGAAAPGVGAGLLVWALSGLALNWSSVRMRKSSRSLDYTFLRDRSIETLDRDLPLVIERIRDAGLAPVFVIDELDKLPEATKTIALIINRLKHLVADYGFFCFLTDRGYFDEIEQTVARRAYPTEHTYFSQRVLVINRPQDLFDYLVRLLDPEKKSDGAEALAINVFALAIVLRSKLNFSDVAREVARLTGEKDELTYSEEELRSPGEFRLAATIQLAINQVLLDENVVERFESDPIFAQLAIDALYFIPRRWEADVDADVDIGREAIKADLLERMRSRTPELASAEEGLEDRRFAWQRRGTQPAKANLPPDAAPFIREADLRLLVDLVRRLAAYLSNFDELKLAVEKRNKAHAPIVIVEKRRMLRPSSARSVDKFSFVLDELATPLRGELPVAEPVSAKRTVGQVPAERPQDLLAATAHLLELTELTIDQLVASRVLPATLTDDLLRTTLGQLSVAEQEKVLPQMLQNALNGRLAFSRALDDYGLRLSQALMLLAQARKEIRSSTPASVSLARIARYIPPGTESLQIENWTPALTRARVRGKAGSIQYFTRRLRAFMAEPETAPRRRNASEDAADWRRWRDHIAGHLVHRMPGPAPVTYDDIVLAAADMSPGRLFRAHLEEMDLIDWSMAALAAMPNELGNREAPPWLLFAALQALGFDQRQLISLVTAGGFEQPDDIEDATAISSFIDTARSAPGGLLHVYADVGQVKRPAAIPRARPLLSVGRDVLEDYMTSLNVLVEFGLIEGGIDEID